MLESEKWSPNFKDCIFPYGFYGLEEYRGWLRNAGFSVLCTELIPKNMVLEGKERLSAWITSTWHPFTQHVPENLKDKFTDELVTRLINLHLWIATDTSTSGWQGWR